MNKRICPLVLILITIVQLITGIKTNVERIQIINGMKTHIEGYYWRDFEGIIPQDALPGGLDHAGRPIYIGQALHENKLIPGKIYEHDPKVYYEWATLEHTATENVRILCSQYPEKFEWLTTKQDEVAKLTNKLLIKGGYEPGYFTYIGRVHTHGETSIGKLICRETDCLGLGTTKDGKGIAHSGPFEVLSFNPEKSAEKNNTTCSHISINVYT